MTLLLRPCSRLCWTVPSTPASPTSTSTSPTSKTPWASLGLRSVWRNTLSHHHQDNSSCTENSLISTDAGVFLLRSAPAHCLHLRPEDARMWLDAGLDHLLCRGHGSGKTLPPDSFSKKIIINKKLNVLLCCSSRPSGAIWEHHCTLALPSRTESQRTSGGLLPSSTSCSPLCRLCWLCAATTTRLIS